LVDGSLIHYRLFLSNLHERGCSRLHSMAVPHAESFDLHAQDERLGTIISKVAGQFRQGLGNSGQADGIQGSDRAVPTTVEMRRIGLKNCPYCDCSEVYASTSATWWQKASVLFLLRLVRCDLCKRRHYRPIFMPAVENPARRRSPRKGVEGAAIKTAEKRPA
jgi:hypothetical protein